MAGNVWEWTADVWRSHPGAEEPFEERYMRVLKGGFYSGNRTRVRCAARSRNYPGFSCSTTSAFVWCCPLSLRTNVLFFWVLDSVFCSLNPETWGREKQEEQEAYGWRTCPAGFAAGKPRANAPQGAKILLGFWGGVAAEQLQRRGAETQRGRGPGRFNAEARRRRGL